MHPIVTVDWSPDGRAVRIIDQRLLPQQYAEIDLSTLDDVCDAIATLAVRGAPAIGVAGAMGLVAALLPSAALDAERFAGVRDEFGARIRATRPTAVNLAWAIDRVLARTRTCEPAPAAQLAAMRAEATAIRDEDRAMCRAIGEHGATLLHEGDCVLTHCNAGALATAGIGTALAPIYVAAERGVHVEVFADETRPLLQGSRLTAWELARAGIPVTVIADSMAASLLSSGRVTCCIVGADRIASNGDVANKIGTYGLALAARHHGVPFYVAAPTSTVDASTATGADIAIEQRAAHELTRGFGAVTAPDSAKVWNPAFDVTPAALVTAIVTDRGIHRPPYHFA